MTAQHTPGPWVDCGFLGKGRLIGPQIAVAYGVASNPASDANARLIAAARDMLAALIKTRDNLSGLSQSDDDIFAAMLRRVDAAIAKATGGGL